MIKSRKGNQIDTAVGARIRNLRLRKRLSQGDVGRQLGVTFQQVQNYENGANRVSAARLSLLAKLFGVPVTALFSEASDSSSIFRMKSNRRNSDDGTNRLV